MKPQKLKLNALLLIGLVGFITGCGNRIPIAEVHPNMALLDSAAEGNPSYSEFETEVKKFYAALQAKDWPTTYEMRTAPFKQDVTQQFYFDSMNKEGKAWSLDTYEVLNIVEFTTPSGETKIRLIMKFVENGSTSYNVVWWKKEGQAWYCEEAGPTRLSLFTATRMPEN
jgi:hypothetical protein